MNTERPIVLLIPTDPQLLEGHPEIGGEPPIAVQLQSGEWAGILDVIEIGTTVRALVLAWDGEVVRAGTDHLNRAGGDHTEEMVEDILGGEDLDGWIVPGELVSTALVMSKITAEIDEEAGDLVCACIYYDGDYVGSVELKNDDDHDCGIWGGSIRSWANEELQSWLFASFGSEEGWWGPQSMKSRNKQNYAAAIVCAARKARGPVASDDEDESAPERERLVAYSYGVPGRAMGDPGCDEDGSWY